MSNKEENKAKFDNVTEVLAHIQKNLHAPKSQFNSFGNYYYRACEDIFDGLKKCMPENAIVTVSDEMVLIGERYYIKATATLSFMGASVSNTAFARESLTKKGMDDSQVTGATSSYARKYALNGLFLIDDVKDSDAQDNKADDDKSNAKGELKKLSGPEFLELQKAIKNSTKETFEGVKKKAKDQYRNMMEAHQKAIAKAVKDKEEELKKEAHDSDQIPHDWDKNGNPIMAG